MSRTHVFRPGKDIDRGHFRAKIHGTGSTPATARGPAVTCASPGDDHGTPRPNSGFAEPALRLVCLGSPACRLRCA